MRLSDILQNYILSAMDQLLDQDKDPTFNEFQNTREWIMVKNNSKPIYQRELILEWDRLYERLTRHRIKKDARASLV